MRPLYQPEIVKNFIHYKILKIKKHLIGEYMSGIKNIEIYFKEANVNAETDEFLKNFSQYVGERLEYYYKNFNYKFRIYLEKYSKEEAVLPVGTLVIIFDLNKPESGTSIPTEIGGSTSELSQDIIKYIDSLFCEFVKSSKS